MSLCVVAAPLVALALGADAFTLAWTHSVEKTEWQEDWQVRAGALVLVEARVRGSGAGMEPPEGSVWRDGWWAYRRDLAVPSLHLAVSGATVDGWRLCTEEDGCRDVEQLLRRDGAAPQTIEIRPGACTP